MTESCNCTFHFIGGRIAGPYAGATGEARALLDLARSVVLGGGGGLDGSCQPREAAAERVCRRRPLSLFAHIFLFNLQAGRVDASGAR